MAALFGAGMTARLGVGMTARLGVGVAARLGAGMVALFGAGAAEGGGGMTSRLASCGQALGAEVLVEVFGELAFLVLQPRRVAGHVALLGEEQ